MTVFCESTNMSWCQQREHRVLLFDCRIINVCFGYNLLRILNFDNSSTDLYARREVLLVDGSVDDMLRARTDSVYATAAFNNVCMLDVLCYIAGGSINLFIYT
jgi:hypothetical protein